MTLSQPTIDRLKVYEKLKQQIAELTLEAEAIQEAVLPELKIGQKVATAYGAFTVESKKKWHYSPETEARDKSLKETKKTEEADGRARATNGKPYLVYRVNKEDPTS